MFGKCCADTKDVDSRKGSVESKMGQGTVIARCIGLFGRWQFMVCMIVFLVNIPLCWQELIIIFIGPKAKFWCKGQQDQNLTNAQTCAQNCKEYEFDTSVFDTTILSEWDLVCDRQMLASAAQTMLMFGVLIGNSVFGILADKFGRRKPLVIAVIIQCVCGIGIAFVPWIWLFILLRFLVAIGAGGTHLTAYCIVIEVTGRKYRSAMGFIFQSFYYLGYASMGGIAYFLREWRYLQMALSVPSVLLVSYFWILPESPRWLLTVNRVEEAIVILEKAAECNKMQTHNIRLLVNSKFGAEEPITENPWDLIKLKKLRFRTLIIFFNWLVIGFCFFGTAEYLGKIGSNVHLNVIISGLIQIPGCFLLILISKYIGRKYVLWVSYAVCSASFFIMTVVPSDPEYITTILGSIGLLNISMAFSIIFIYASELFPTVVRNTGMGMSCMFAKFGSMAAPFVETLTHYNDWIVPLILGVVPLLAFVTIFFMPETLGARLPDTIEEAEVFEGPPRTRSTLSTISGRL